MIATRAGPLRATQVRTTSVRGRRVVLAVLVEVWGAGERRAGLEERLAAGLVRTFETSSGSLTARVREALLAGHSWLLAQGPGADGELLGAGTSVLVVADGEAVLAQAGPSVAFGPADATAPGEPVRQPAASPWLKRGLTALTPDAAWPALGLGAEPVLHWARWPVLPGGCVLLAATASAESLTRDTVAALFLTAPEGAARALDTLMGADTAALLLRWPGAVATPATVAAGAATVATAAAVSVPEGPGAGADPPLVGLPGTAPSGPGEAAAGQGLRRRWGGLAGLSGLAAEASRRLHGEPSPPPSSAAATAPGAPRSPTGEPVAPSGGKAQGASAASKPPAAAPVAAATVLGARRLNWQPYAARAARGTSRVMLGLLPKRAAGGQDSYRVERARLAAIGAIGLPALVLLWTIFQVLRFGPAEGLPATAAPSGLAPLAGATMPAVDDPAARIVRLTDATPLVALPGQAADDRVVVAPGGLPYVLNRVTDQVDRLAGGELTPVLRRGQVVGQDTVGEPEDLFVVPGAGSAQVLALDAAGSLWDLGGEQVKRVPRAELPGWLSVTRATGFGTNLYAMDRAAGQIWRYIPAGAGAYTAPGTGWLAEPARMADTVDLAIDGNVYLLGEDGGVRKFVDGSPSPFQLADVPEGFSRGQSIYASATSDGLLLTDPVNARLLRFAPDGSFTHQLLFPPLASTADETTRAGRLRDLAGAWWDEAGDQLYVVAGTWLYRAGYGGG